MKLLTLAGFWFFALSIVSGESVLNEEAARALQMKRMGMKKRKMKRMGMKKRKMGRRSSSSSSSSKAKAPKSSAKKRKEAKRSTDKSVKIEGKQPPDPGPTSTPTPMFYRVS
jgi:hypothetical protein